jgi:hypothetical protein
MSASLKGSSLPASVLDDDAPAVRETRSRLYSARRLTDALPSFDRWLRYPIRSGWATIDRLARPVDVNGDACRVFRRFDELEVQRGAQFLEQGEVGAECGRLDHEPILVDQPES